MQQTVESRGVQVPPVPRISVSTTQSGLSWMLRVVISSYRQQFQPCLTMTCSLLPANHSATPAATCPDQTPWSEKLQAHRGTVAVIT